MSKIIYKKNFNKLIQDLIKEIKVWAPIQEGDDLRIKELSNESNIDDLNFTDSTSILAPKFLFFPSREITFKINKNVLVPEAKEPFILICSFKDLEGILDLDQVMLKEPMDFYYYQRRELSTIIAIKNDTSEQKQGGDLILEDVGDYYLATAFSEKGKDLLKNELFEEKDIKTQKQNKKSSDFENLLLDSELLKDAIIWSRNHPIWDELAETCLGCGICTYVCPLCYCFSNEDEKSFNGEKCQRCRRWDSCILPDFALIAGGKNFRSTLKQRYYNWYYHKFVRAYQEFGRSHCVACGRCQTYCPAQIDIYQVLLRIVGDYKKTLQK